MPEDPVTCWRCMLPDPPPDPGCPDGLDHIVGPAAGCPDCGRLAEACEARPCSARRALAGDGEAAAAARLLEQALFLRMNGERPPGAPRDDPEAETWRKWDRECEVFLRARYARLGRGLPAGEEEIAAQRAAGVDPDDPATWPFGEEGGVDDR